MKKLLTVTLALVMVLGLMGGMAVAENPNLGANRVPLDTKDDTPEGASASAIINQNANGDYMVLLQVRNVEEDEWIAWGVGTGDRISEFQCNTVGHGTDQLLLIEGEDYMGKEFKDIGDVINVKAIDDADGDGPIIFTADISE